MQLTRSGLVLLSLMLASAAHAQPGMVTPTPEPPATPPDAPLETRDDPTATVRAGVYADSDQTKVWRLLGVVGQTSGNWIVGASVSVDAVTSASIDVKTTPGLVDVVSSASSQTTTGMTDQRYQATANAGWTDTAGTEITVTAAGAKENDYKSISGGVNGAHDLAGRTTTLLGGITATQNWISSTLDPDVHGLMFAVAYTVGVAQVLTPRDAIRFRYDGKTSIGFLESPYRRVRFGDWLPRESQGRIVFDNTLDGGSDGLIEDVPDQRISHAVVGEWVHSLAANVGLHGTVRGSHDTWGVDSLTAGLELRWVQPTFRILLGVRYYGQTAADFFEDKYVMSADHYDHYTFDKDLGRHRAQTAQFELARVIREAENPGDDRFLFTLLFDATHDEYPGFQLLPSRDSLFASVGLSWEH